MKVWGKTQWDEEEGSDVGGATHMETLLWLGRTQYNLMKWLKKALVCYHGPASVPVRWPLHVPFCSDLSVSAHMNMHSFRICFSDLCKLQKPPIWLSTRLESKILITILPAVILPWYYISEVFCVYPMDREKSKLCAYSEGSEKAGAGENSWSSI